MVKRWRALESKLFSCARETISINLRFDIPFRMANPGVCVCVLPHCCEPCSAKATVEGAGKFSGTSALNSDSVGLILIVKV